MFRLFLLIVLVVSFPRFLDAHGTGYRILEQDRSVITLECYYSDGNAMSYAEVCIFSPEGSDKNSEVEYQNGRTDYNGRFAFSPDSSGTWKVEVNDGMGHKIQTQIKVDLESKTQVKISKSEFKKESKSIKACLGISLIFNIGTLFHCLFNRKRR